MYHSARVKKHLGVILEVDVREALVPPEQEAFGKNQINYFKR